MKKIAIVIGIIVVLFAALASPYNNLVSKRETVEAQWAQVENVYQRRADLIPNLVSTVKGYASHEKSTLEAVIQARSNLTKVDFGNMSQEQLASFQSSQGALSGALSRLMLVMERYPDLKANQNFLELQSQLEGTENRIAFERKGFNDAARSYNTDLQTFPNNLFAKLFGFAKKPYFEAEEGSKTAPKVEF
ncbi:MAG: LemA family protein [Candidatus Melainabacteria bacterium]|jgi:LemA protein|nr:LemA family protein [Candidatus Melainabacteria bacterium]